MFPLQFPSKNFNIEQNFFISELSLKLNTTSQNLQEDQTKLDLDSKMTLPLKAKSLNFVIIGLLYNQCVDYVHTLTYNPFGQELLINQIELDLGSFIIYDFELQGQIIVFNYCSIFKIIHCNFVIMDFLQT